MVLNEPVGWKEEEEVSIWTGQHRHRGRRREKSPKNGVRMRHTRDFLLEKPLVYIANLYLFSDRTEKTRK